MSKARQFLEEATPRGCFKYVLFGATPLIDASWYPHPRFTTWNLIGSRVQAARMMLVPKRISFRSTFT